MSFRFRRSIRLGKGLRINLSKSGASLSVGRRGATMNIGPKGQKVTLGLPGTGLSYSKMIDKNRDGTAPPSTGAPRPEDRSSSRPSPLAWLAAIAIAVLIFGAITAAFGQ